MKKVDLLSEEGLKGLFERFGGDEDEVLEYLRANCDVPNGDLQAVVECYESTH